MKINLAKSAGFCFGVKRALTIAFNAAQEKNKVFMLGDIVHNEDVVKEINKSGIKKINQLSKGENKTLLIRAHGASQKTLARARSLRYKIIDATCPMVKEIHKIAVNAEKKGYHIIVIGDKKHDEVLGIIGQLKNKAIVIDGVVTIPLRKIKEIRKAAVVVQSTQTIENTMAIIAVLKKHIKQVLFFNTICKPTRIKQEEIKQMPINNDAMIIICSKTSANTKRLYEIARSLNKRSYWIQSKDEINPLWLKSILSVGIAAGASTPDSTTRAVIDTIKKITSG